MHKKLKSIATHSTANHERALEYDKVGRILDPKPNISEMLFQDLCWISF
jgi:hypothetical protein